MTTAYTSLLGLALPVTGELSGTWGDTVNTAITSLLDSAVAGTTSITTDADITLTTTTGASNQARQAIILWNPASGTVTRNITAPAQSKMYTVINASGGTQSIVIRGVGPTTGVTVLKGESALVAWNGSDFVKVSSIGGSLTLLDLTVTGNTILGDAAADTLTVNATTSFTSPVKLPSTGRSAAAALTVTNPAFLYGVASTYTDTTSSGTIAAMAPFYGLAQPTLSTSNVTTYTNAATLYIANAPTAGGSATITNPYSIYVAAGAAYFGGGIVNSGLTSGRVVYSTTGGLETDSANFVFDGTNVGIGTSSPSYKLDVNGQIRIQGGNFLRLTTTGTTNLGYLGNYNTIIGSGNATDVLLYNAASGGIYLSTAGGNLLIDSSGNVGIGTSAPTYQTQIYGTGQTTAALTDAGNKGGSLLLNTPTVSGGDGGALLFGAGGSGAKPYAAIKGLLADGAGNTTGNLAFSTRNATADTALTERMRIDTSGNVGIGTSSPSTYSSVYKTVNAIKINDQVTTIGSYYQAGVAQYGFINVSDAVGTTAVSLVFSSGSNVERMRIDSAGNVGIGTSSPSGKLDVRTAAGTSAVMNLSSGSNATQTKFSIQQIGAVDWDVGISATSGNFYIGGLGGTMAEAYKIVRSGTAIDYQTWNTGGSERMRIDSSGNVGIGTSSPSTTPKMTVQGGGTNGYGGIRILSDTTYSNGANYQAYGRRGDGNPSGAFAGGTLLARVNTAPAALISGINLGRVGFGGSYDGTDANIVYGAQITGQASGTYSSTSAATDLVFYTTPSGTAGGTTTGTADFGTERMRIDSSGNVGIGTNSPASKLNVESASAESVRIGYSSTKTARLGVTSAGNLQVYAFDSTTVNYTNILLAVDGSTSAGKLLVGTTSTSYGMKMTVDGGISSIGVNQFNIAGTASGSDFEWVLRQGSRQLFYVTNATVVANLSATGVWTNASDARYKENIVDSQYGLSTVMALKPRAYNLINQTDKPQIGFIAQEVLEVIPEVVESVHNAVTEEDRYTLSYGNMVAVLTKAIQEQQALITSLTARIEALEST